MSDLGLEEMTATDLVVHFQWAAALGIPQADGFEAEVLRRLAEIADLRAKLADAHLRIAQLEASSRGES